MPVCVFLFAIDLLRRLNALEESINDRHRQLNGAIEQRREFDRIMTKISEWIKTTEQQIKDPFASDLQQNASGIKDKHRSIQVGDLSNLLRNLFRIDFRD